MAKMIGKIYYKKSGNRSRPFALFECECGKIWEARSDVKVQLCKSCASKKSSIKHGGSKTRLYRIWRGMKKRTSLEAVDSYQYYGAKGIAICKEWKTSFESFQDWALKNGYSDNLTIDRIDPSGDYEPKNCRWITQEENSSRAYGYDRFGEHSRITMSLDDTSDAIEAYCSGFTMRDIAAHFDTSIRAVASLIHRARVDGCDIPYKRSDYA